MSWLSEVTGIGIDPLKGKIKINPLKAINTIGAVATGGLSAIPGAALTNLGGSAIGGALKGALGGLQPTGGFNPNTFGAIPQEAMTVTGRHGTQYGGSVVPDDPQRSSGALGGIMDFLQGNDGRNLLGLLAGGTSAYNAYRGSQERARAERDLERQRDQVAPIGAMGVSGLMNPQASVGGIDQIRRQGNPYAGAF